ncbi:hypothetical protein PHMEG_00038559, partial [Phytophthora megakarya]
DLACEFGHLHVVKWLHMNRSEGCNAFCMYRAIRNRHFDVVLFLHVHCKEPFYLRHSITETLPLEMQQWLRAHYADETSRWRFEVYKIELEDRTTQERRMHKPEHTSPSYPFWVRPRPRVQNSTCR